MSKGDGKSRHQARVLRLMTALAGMN